MPIRPAKAEDAAAINHIYNQAVEAKLTGDTMPISDDARRAWIEQHANSIYPVFIAEENNRIRGWLSFSAYRPGRQAMVHTAEISYYVNHEDHRSGTGTRLVEFAVSTAPQYRFANLLAIILDHNTASIRLLEKCGFHRWGLLPDIAVFDGVKRSHVYYGINI
jgi:L-amino acid N-acyltransferase YncA